MPSSVSSMAVQKKQIIPPSQGPLSIHIINSQRKTSGHERQPDTNRMNSQEKKTSCSINTSARICIPNRLNPAAANGNIDERLKAARERREEQRKLLASRELSRLEREQRARQYHEEQLQQRKKRVLEQRLKEERRRVAVEEKRKLRLQEDKERNETTVRRTLEKSQRAAQIPNLIPKGKKVTKNAPRRSPLTTWEKNLVSRLLTPTHSYLARSRSAACQSGEEVSFHPMNTTTNHSSTLHKPQHHPAPVRTRPSASPSPNTSQHCATSLSQIKPTRQQEARKKISNTRSPSVTSRVKPVAVSNRTAPPSPNRTPRRSISRHSSPLQPELPTVPEEDVAIPSSAAAPGNSRPVRTSAGNTRSIQTLAGNSRPIRTSAGNSRPIQTSAGSSRPVQTSAGNSRPVRTSPGNTRPVQTSAEALQKKTRRGNPPETPCLNLPGNKTEAATAGDKTPPQTPPPSAPQPPQPPQPVCRSPAGTMDPEEASRLLAEKRREARLQREKEEQERLQREEAERRSHEELERRRAEERERQQRLIEEVRRKEEEEQRQAEEERAQAIREAALLQKQREEEQAKEKEKAEQIRQEREVQAQKEDAARQARRKRLEEIMRRTRRTDSPDTKPAAQPKENTEPVHNGTIEDAAKLPAGSKTSQLGRSLEEDVVPVVAFKERRSLRTLTGLEEIQTHQRAEVI